MMHPSHWSKFLFDPILHRRAAQRSFGLLMGLWLLVSGSPAAADEECGTSRIEFSARGPRVTRDGDLGRDGFGGRSQFFDQVCDEFIDTEHFRLHYSTMPGWVAIPGTPVDVAVNGARALIAALDGGLQVVDIAVPGRPAVVGSIPVPGSTWRVVADGEHAALLADDALHILRTGDPTAIAGTIQFASSPRGLAIQGATVYVVAGSSLEVIDATHPEVPLRVGSLSLPGDPGEVAVAGEWIAVAAGEPGIVVIDGSDQGQPRIEAIVDTPGIPTGVAMEEGLIYVADGARGLVLIRLGWEGWNWVGSVPSVGAAIRVAAQDREAFVIGANGNLLMVRCSPPEQPALLDGATFLGDAQGVALGETHAYVVVPGFGLQVVSTIAPDGGPWLRQLQDQIQGWPNTAFRDSLAVAFENAYDVFQAMGFRPPVGDGKLGGGKDRVDCYVYRLPPTGGLAYTHPEDRVTTDCESTFYGHLGVDNVGVASISRLKDVAAHELFHLIQYAYDRFEETWFLESTAVWAEEHVRPSQALSGDVRCWFNTPFLNLWSRSPGCRMYGSVHFWLFQELTTDETIVRRCLERGCLPDVEWRAALKAELGERNLDFNRQLAEFARWNYCTGERDDGSHYPQTMPPIDFQAEHAVFPVSHGEVNQVAESAGSNYVRFFGPGRRDTLKVSFTSDPRLREWREVVLVATRAPNLHREWTLDLDKEGRANALIPDWPGCAAACLIVANGDTSGSALGPVDYAFSYSVVEIGPAPSTSVALPGPNPTASQTTIAWRLAEESAWVKLDIYDLSGRLVRRLADQAYDRGDHQLTWDGMARDDRRAPSGVYFYRMDLDGSLYRGRLILVR